jgi:hypothetical protein
MILNLGRITPRDWRRVTAGENDLIGKPLSVLRPDDDRALQIHGLQCRDLAPHPLELNMRRRGCLGLRQMVLQILTIEGARQIALGVHLRQVLAGVMEQVIRILRDR